MSAAEPTCVGHVSTLDEYTSPFCGEGRYGAPSEPRCQSRQTLHRAYPYDAPRCNSKASYRPR